MTANLIKKDNSIAALREQPASSDLTEIIFKKTNNFWIDNGIIGLYDVLTLRRSYFEQAFDAQLLSLGEDKLTVSIKKECISPFFAELKRFLIEAFLCETNNYSFYYDQTHDEFVLSRKRDILPDKKYYFQGFIPKPAGKISLQDLSISAHKKLDNFLVKNMSYKISVKGDIPTSKMVFALSNKTVVDSGMLKAGKKLCGFCGSRFKKLISLDGMHFPLLVGFSNLKTFYSNLNNEFRLCGKCSLAALAGSYKSYFSINNSYLNCFVIYGRNLSETYALQSKLPALTNNTYGNFDKHSIITTFFYETLFVFLLNIFVSLRHEWKQGRLRDILTNKVIGFMALKQGNNVTYEHMVEFCRITEFFTFLEKTAPAAGIAGSGSNAIEWPVFLNSLYLKPDDSSVLRDHICERILNFNKVNDLIEEFLFRSGRTNKNLSYFIKTYHREVVGMEESMIDLCAAIGSEIGKKAKIKDTKGFLYAIRNCKYRSEFIKTLSQIQFPLEINYSKILFESLQDENWEDYKSLISIFAANQFFYNPKKEDTKDE